MWSGNDGCVQTAIGFVQATIDCVPTTIGCVQASIGCSGLSGLLYESVEKITNRQFSMNHRTGINLINIMSQINVLSRIILFISIATVGLNTACTKDKLPLDDAPAGQPDPEWRLLTTSNSQLPDNQVNVIAIGTNDVKWIGTSKGLVRIIGDSWTVFTTVNSSLPGLYVQALAVEANGRVWIGTDKGLASLNGSEWKVYTTDNSLLPDNAIMSMTHDSKFGRTWIGTAKGLVRIDNTGSWKLYDETSGDLLHSLATDQQGHLWMGAFNHFQFQGRIKELADDRWTTYKLNDAGYMSTFPYSIAVDKDNAVIALLTGTSVSAVVRLNAGTFEEIEKPRNATGLKTLMLEGEHVWVGGNQLSVFGSVSSPLIKIPGNDYSILSLAKDTAGRKWIGTIGGGLAIYND